MFHKNLQPFKNESGVTLVELLAAIAILSIIVVSFLGVFIQSAKTNNRTGHVNEATYIAQAELENVVKYNQSENLSLTNYKTSNASLNGYNVTTVVTEKTINKTGPKLFQVKVSVRQGDDIVAQMETWLPQKEIDKDTNSK